MQPVYVSDVARAFTTALERPESIGKLYELGGPDIFTFKQILKTISHVIDKSPLFLSIPAGIAKGPIALLQALGVTLPITRDQLIMLQEDNIRKSGDDVGELGVEWKEFEEGIGGYLKTGNH